MKTKYPHLTVTFTGYFASRMVPEAAAYVAAEMKTAGVTQDEVNEYYTEARKGGVQGFLDATRKWVTVKLNKVTYHLEKRYTQNAPRTKRK